LQLKIKENKEETKFALFMIDWKIKEKGQLEFAMSLCSVFTCLDSFREINTEHKFLL